MLQTLSTVRRGRQLACAALLGLAIVALPLSGPARAASTLPTPLVITALVLKVCVAGLPTPIALSTITATSGLTGAGAVAVTCTPGATYDVLLDQGANAANGSTPTQRKLKSLLSAATMTYGLYQDAAYSTPWGATSGSNTLHKTASGILEVWPVYMKVDATSAAAATAGDYADTVQVSVEY